MFICNIPFKNFSLIKSCFQVDQIKLRIEQDVILKKRQLLCDAVMDMKTIINHMSLTDSSETPCFLI